MQGASLQFLPADVLSKVVRAMGFRRLANHTAPTVFWTYAGVLACRSCSRVRSVDEVQSRGKSKLCPSSAGTVPTDRSGAGRKLELS